ncbi:hypothetical protein ACWDSJ_26435 [Nocardia sp. NPDC003482]
MCLLTYVPAGIAPDTTALEVGARVNDDGHGFAIVAGSRLVIGRGMNAEQVIDEFARARARFLDGPALFHSRFATHGIVGIPNCHPFHLGRDHRTVLAHNGVLPRRVQPRGFDRRSDTRIAAERYLPGRPFGSLDTPEGRRGLESWLGTSKLVLLTVNPAYLRSGYVFNENAGIWDGGIWYSNSGYLPDSPRHQLRWLSTCWGCGRYEPRRQRRYCPSCGWCSYCLSPFPDCDCPPLTRCAARALERASHSHPTESATSIPTGTAALP